MTVETTAVPIPCDWPDCTVTRLSIGALAGHFVNRHGVSSSVAHERAAKVQREFVKADPYGLDRNGVKVAEPAVAAQPPATGPVTPATGSGPDVPASRSSSEAAGRSPLDASTAPPILTASRRAGPGRAGAVTNPPVPKEPAMATIDEPIKCADCRESFVREHGRQTKCKKCRGAKGCSYCKRVGEHTATCPRAGTKPNKATGGAMAARPSKKKPSQEPAVSRNGASPYGSAIAALDEQIAKLTTARDVLAAM